MTEEEKKQIDAFQKKIGLSFKDESLLFKALIHRSYLNEKRSEFENNERLEFLGDAVLELLISDYLFKTYPNRPEGDLTSFRAATVKTESLAETAASLKFGDFIFMSKGEEMTGGRTRPFILANTYEAVLGAIYLDQGLKYAQTYVEKTLVPKIDEIVKKRLDIDPKSQLQEISQEVLKETPTYELVEFKGPDHDRIFTMKVLVGKKEFGRGEGNSKQEAEQNAAMKALEDWEKTIA